MRNADLAERIDTVEHRMDSMEQRLDASFNALSTQILQSRRENDVAHLAMRAEMNAMGTALRAEMKAQGTDLRGAIREGDEETRRFMMILHEDTLSKIALIGEGRRSSS